MSISPSWPDPIEPAWCHQCNRGNWDCQCERFRMMAAQHGQTVAQYLSCIDKKNTNIYEQKQKSKKLLLLK